MIDALGESVGPSPQSSPRTRGEADPITPRHQQSFARTSITSSTQFSLNGSAVITNRRSLTAATSYQSKTPSTFSHAGRLVLATSYSRTTYRRTTIGAAAFHFRVRNGNGWGHCAMITRNLSRLLRGSFLARVSRFGKGPIREPRHNEPSLKER